MKEIELEEFNNNGKMCESCAVQHYKPAELERIRKEWQSKSDPNDKRNRINKV